MATKKMKFKTEKLEFKEYEKYFKGSLFFNE